MSFSAGKNLENNVNTTEAQTLYKKTLLGDTNTIDGANIDNCTITNASIVSPDKLQMKSYADLATAQADLANRSGGELVYVADIKKTYQVNDDGLGTKTLAEISGGQGGVNYIENSDFEQGVDGYSASGVTFTIAQTKVAGEVLRGEASAKLSKTAVDATGAEISVPFTVSRADLAKKLTISFEYDASDAAYADDDIQVYVKQDPNGTPSVIRINGEDLKGGKGTHYAQFQTDASQTEYELVFKVNSTNASAYSVIIDDVKVGPTNLAFGTVVTDWEGYTPTFSGINAGTAPNQIYRWRRVGDTMEVTGFVEAGGTGMNISDAVTVSIPSGYTIDTNKIKASLEQNLGSVSLLDQLVRRYVGSVNYSSLTSVRFVVDTNFLAPNIPSTAWFDSPSDAISWSFKVPIVGWSSNTVMSEDLGGREVFMGVVQSGTQSLITGDWTDITFWNTPYSDTTSAWSATNDYYVIPESGYYFLEYGLGFAVNAAGSRAVALKVNSSGPTSVELAATSPGDTGIVASKTTVRYFNKGDTVGIMGYQSSGGNLNATLGNFIVNKIPSPQTILESETVAARYTSSDGQEVSNNGEELIYLNLIKDTHSAYNESTGRYIIPISGWYMVKASYLLVDVTKRTFSQIRKYHSNGITLLESSSDFNSVSNGESGGSNVELMYFNKGEQVAIFVYQDDGVNRLLTNSETFNQFSIARIK